jgi:hypothetical protein
MISRRNPFSRLILHLSINSPNLATSQSMIQLPNIGQGIGCIANYIRPNILHTAIPSIFTKESGYHSAKVALCKRIGDAVVILSELIESFAQGARKTAS